MSVGSRDELGFSDLLSVFNSFTEFASLGKDWPDPWALESRLTCKIMQKNKVVIRDECVGKGKVKIIRQRLGNGREDKTI